MRRSLAVLQATTTNKKIDIYGLVQECNRAEALVRSGVRCPPPSWRRCATRWHLSMHGVPRRNRHCQRAHTAAAKSSATRTECRCHSVAIAGVCGAADVIRQRAAECTRIYGLRGTAVRHADSSGRAGPRTSRRRMSDTVRTCSCPASLRNSNCCVAARRTGSDCLRSLKLPMRRPRRSA